MATTLGIISLLIHVSHQQTLHTYDCDKAGTNCNTEIILPSTSGTDTYTFNCRNTGDCTNLILYIGDKGSLIFNCYGGCQDMEVYVGKFDPPGSTYDASNMNDDMTVTIYCSEDGACQNVLLACKGTGINICSLFAEQGTNPIQSSTVECDAGSSQCELDCKAGCSGANNLLCHSGASGCQCVDGCTSVTQTNGVTWPPTSSPPTTAAPTTTSPTTSNPTTFNPTTFNPTTAQPTTSMPTTVIPTTNNPTTAVPTTTSPTTVAPTTSQPTTNAPTTNAPTTNAPTTNAPTTNQPTTNEPTTAEPTTDAPTTMEPTPNEPTTNQPTTKEPTKSDNSGGVGEETTVDISNTRLKNSAQKSESALDTMTLLYIIIGALSGIIVLGCILCLCYRKNMKSKPHENVEKVDMGIELNYVGSSLSPMSTNGTKTTMEGEGIAGTVSEDMHLDDVDGNDTNSTGDNILNESDDDTDNMYEMDDDNHVTAGGDNDVNEKMHVTPGGDMEIYAPNNMQKINSISADMGENNGMDGNQDDSDDDVNGLYSEEMRNVTSGK